MQIMLAADMCRLLLKEQPEELLSTLQSWSEAGDAIVISSITYAELLAAAMLTKDQKRHMTLVRAFGERLDEIVAWDTDAVDNYSILQARAMELGRHLNMNDAMLAAHAISCGARLLVMNDAGFDGMAGLDLQVWRAA